MFSRSKASWAFAVIGVASCLWACNSLTGLDDFERAPSAGSTSTGAVGGAGLGGSGNVGGSLNPAGSGGIAGNGGIAGSTGTGATATSGGVGGAAIPECMSNMDCAKPEDTVCAWHRCDVSGNCVLELEPSGVNCGLDVSFRCDGQGACVTCLMNGQVDVGETDVDCGGQQCPGCDDEKVCLVDDDCASRRCQDNPSGPGKICFPGECNNGQADGAETDVDCGGVCQPCVQGRQCSVQEDCDTGFCVDGICCGVRCDGPCQQCQQGTGACIQVGENEDPGDKCPGLTNVCDAEGTCTFCSNGIQETEPDRAETDRDCGGPICGPCDDGSGCETGLDCASGICVSGNCQPPDCNNGVKDGFEGDTDCGGLCPVPCGAGQECQTKTDCASRSCVQGVCVP